MSSYLWTSTSSSDPTLGANWTKSDGTTGTAPGASDDVYIAAVSGLSLASIWAAGGVGNPPTSLNTSGASSTGGHLAQSTTYYYKVATIYSNGESQLSNELSYTTPASGTSTNQITVNWTAPTSGGTPTGYKIYRSTASNGELYLDSVGNVTSYADTTANVPAGSPPGTVTFNSLNISQTFSGTIGNAGVSGYWWVSATTINIGTPANDGSTPTGSGRIKLNCQAVAFTLNVLATGTTLDTGYEPVRVLGTSANNVVNVLSGTVGIGTNQPGETSNVSGASNSNNGVNVAGSSAILNLGPGVTWSNANVAGGGTLMTNSGSSGTVSVSSGSTVTLKGTALVATINNNGYAYISNRPAAGAGVTTLNTYGSGTSDFSQAPSNVTVTTSNQYPGGKLVAFAANPGHLSITTRNLIDCGTLTASSS